MPSATSVMIMIVGVLFLGASSIVLGFFLWYKLQFKHTFKIKCLYSNGVVPIERKARLVMDNTTNTKKWQIAKEKDITKKYVYDVPPNCIFPSEKKGCMVVECYRVEPDGMYIFDAFNIKVASTPANLYDDMPKEFDELESVEARELAVAKWKQQKYTEWIKKNNLDVVHKPITPNQRQSFATNIKKANDRNRPTLWSILPYAASILSLLIVIAGVVAVMVLWQDFAQPSITIQKERTTQLQVQKEIVTVLKTIDDKIQLLEDENTAIKSKVEEQNAKIDKALS